MVDTLTAKKSLPEIHFTELPEDDIKWCAVSLADIFKAKKRLEASVFEIGGRHAREIIANCKYGTLPLSEIIIRAYYPGRFKRIYSDSVNGVPFFLPSQMTAIRPHTDKYISAITKYAIDDLRLIAGDVLLTRSGTIGKVILVSKTLENAVYSDDVIRLTPKDGMAGYLYAYLRSEVGNTILQTNQYGSVIKHIEPEHLANIFAPNPPWDIKRRINDLVVRSFALRDESNDLIDRATTMLVEALKLPPIQEIKTKQFGDGAEANNFSVRLSDVAGRLDASCHAPIATAITKHLYKHANEVTTIGDKRVSKKIILPGRFKRIYVDEGQGRVFIGGKQIHELDPLNKKYLSLALHGTRIKDQLELHENMTLITCSGTIGKIALVPKHWENWAASQHIIRVVPADENIAGFIAVFLSSDYAHPLITRYIYGSVVDEIDANHVAQIPFPILKDDTTQAKINRLALEANQLRYEAYELEQKALQIMNDEVIFAK
ncbi:MAG: hypothetical protein LBO03_04495 [Acidaminococcales bacterium]|jgi:type I restriction enzyme S subunit|nr:hypothetical protein [Acidaminococcales bacterium]